MIGKRSVHADETERLALPFLDEVLFCVDKTIKL